MLRQDLDRDRAIEPRVLRLVDLAHSPGADWREDLVGTEAGSGGKGQDWRKLLSHSGDRDYGFFSPAASSARRRAAE